MGSERLGDIEDTEDLGVSTKYEDEERSVEVFGLAALTTAEPGDEAIFGDEQASVEGVGSVAMTRPKSCSNSWPWQHPASDTAVPSFSPQHQLTV